MFEKHVTPHSVSHYEVLNVPQNASQEEIKKAFFEKSKKYHPDVSPDNPHHHKIFVKLNNAYSVLSNISKRRDYDRSLRPKNSSHCHPSNEDFYKDVHVYRDNPFYYGSNSSNSFTGTYPTSNRPKNYLVALAVVVLMSLGVALRLVWIRYGHQRHKKQLDYYSMKASESYQQSRERSSQYSVREQLEMLAQKQDKSSKRP